MLLGGATFLPPFLESETLQANEFCSTYGLASLSDDPAAKAHGQEPVELIVSYTFSVQTAASTASRCNYDVQ